MENEPLVNVRRETGCCSRFLSSSGLALAVVSVLLMLDVMLITVVEPILPGILYEIDQLQQEGISWENWLKSLFTPMKNHNNASSDSELYTQLAPQIGLIMGLKPGVEVIGNVIVGPVVDRFGHKIPLLLGSVLYTLTAGLFALSPNFATLITARILQAIGSSLSTVSGLALLASVYTDDTRRARASSIAFGGLSLGLIAGFPFGAIATELLGRAAPFLALGVVSLVDAILRIIMKPPIQGNIDRSKQSLNMGILLELLKNKYILTVLVSDYFLHFGLGVVFTCVPTFMQDTLRGSLWEMACVVFLSTSVQFTIQYFCTTRISATSRWKVLFPSLAIFALAQFIYPIIGATRVIWFAMIPECILRVSMGLFTATAYPTLCFLADSFYESQYGAINGLYTGTFNLGMFSGSIFAGYTLPKIGFQSVFHISAVFVLFSSLLSVAHRNLKKDLLLTEEKNIQHSAHASGRRSRQYSTSIASTWSNSSRMF